MKFIEFKKRDYVTGDIYELHFDYQNNINNLTIDLIKNYREKIISKNFDIDFLFELDNFFFKLDQKLDLILNEVKK